MNADEQVKLLLEMLEQQKQNSALQEARIAEQADTIADLRSLVAELRGTIASLEETLAEFRRQFFGIKSEKSKKTHSEEESDETSSVSVKSHTRQKKAKATREEQYKDLPVREEIIHLTDEEMRCPWCNALMKVIKSTFVREEIRITPAKVERVRIMQETAVCPECKKDGDGTFVKAKTPTALIPHSPASASAVAFVAFYKVFLGLPYYRQETAFDQFGFKLPRETQANWIIYCALNYLKPIYNRLHGELLKRDIICADETTCQVLREEGRAATTTSYMWIYISGNDGKAPIRLYDYEPGRKGFYPQGFLHGFRGLLQCDGYQGYNKVDDVILVCCLAHQRRKFYEALPAKTKKTTRLFDINTEGTMPEPILPDEEKIREMIPAEVGLMYCNCLFYIERQLKGMPYEERKNERKKKETPIWEKFFCWVDGIEPVGGSKFQKAITYALNHRESLRNYLLDGRCEISNNAAERVVKSYAIGRKNSLFHTSVKGAQASAIMYSLVETAKANDLNVFQYIYLLLLYMPDYQNEPAGIEQLLPWSDFIKEHCSGLADVETITAENRPSLT